MPKLAKYLFTIKKGLGEQQRKGNKEKNHEERKKRRKKSSMRIMTVCQGLR